MRPLMKNLKTRAKRNILATYEEIRKWVLKEYGLKLHSGGCHIAHCKELAGISRRCNTWNRQGNERKHPCPEHLREPIFEAFRHFGML